MLDGSTKRPLAPHILASIRLAAECSRHADLRQLVRDAFASCPDFVPSDVAAEREAARVRFMLGAARKAARDNRPLGRAYREDSRDWSGYVHGGDYEQYAAAYDEERAAGGEVQ